MFFPDKNFTMAFDNPPSLQYNKDATRLDSRAPMPKDRV